MNTPEFEMSVISAYEDGQSTCAIAKELNTYPNKIRRILIKHGKEMRDRSEAQKNALKTGVAEHPTQGRKRSYKEKLKISKSMVKSWNSIDDTERERRAEMSRQQWLNMSNEDRDNMRQAATEALKHAARQGSKFENFIYRKLSDYGFNIESHKKDLIYNQKLEIDLYISDLKTIIEVDGPSHFFPVWGEDKLAKQIKADNEKNGLILSKGFVVVRLKVLKNVLSLQDQQDFLDQLLSVLEDIRSEFPTRDNRYIEVEI